MVAGGKLYYIDTLGTEAEVRRRVSGSTDLSPEGNIVTGLVLTMKEYLHIRVDPVVEFVWTGWNQREHECALVVNEMVRRLVVGEALTSPLPKCLRMTQASPWQLSAKH